MDFQALAYGEANSSRPYPVEEQAHSVRGRKHVSQDCMIEEYFEIEEEEEETQKSGRNGLLRRLTSLHFRFLALLNANKNILSGIVPWQTPFAERFNRISYQLKTIILII